MYTLEFSSNSTWLLVGGWLICMQILPCLVNFQCMLGGSSVEIWTKSHILYCSLKVKLILAYQEVLKWLWLSMNQPNSSFEFQSDLRQECTITNIERNKLLNLYAKQPMGNRRGDKLPTKSYSHCVEGIGCSRLDLNYDTRLTPDCRLILWPKKSKQ